MKYCPNCGAEYRPGFERCSDCGVALVDEPPVAAEEEGAPRWEQISRVEVFRTGRRLDAEMIRGMLEARGFDARVWASGMGVWRMESAMTEITGVPSDFNSYRVVVLEDEADDARAVIQDIEGPDAAASSTLAEPYDYRGVWFMDVLRSRWVLVGAALFLLAGIILFGPPGLAWRF